MLCARAWSLPISRPPFPLGFRLFLAGPLFLKASRVFRVFSPTGKAPGFLHVLIKPCRYTLFTSICILSCTILCKTVFGISAESNNNFLDKILDDYYAFLKCIVVIIVVCSYRIMKNIYLGNHLSVNLKYLVWLYHQLSRSKTFILKCLFINSRRTTKRDTEELLKGKI